MATSNIDKALYPADGGLPDLMDMDEPALDEPLGDEPALDMDAPDEMSPDEELEEAQIELEEDDTFVNEVVRRVARRLLKK